MKIFLFFIISAFATTLSYEELSQFALKIPHDNNTVIIFLGRSPSLLSAYYKNLKDVKSYNLPLSGLKFSQEVLNFRNIRWKVMRHFRKYLPNKLFLKNKRVVVVDYTYTGRSLVAGLELIDYYYNTFSLLPNLNIEYFAFSFNDDEKVMPFPKCTKGQYICLHSKFGKTFSNQLYDDLSQYGPYYPAFISKNPVRKKGPKFEKLRYQLYHLQKQDQSLNLKCPKKSWKLLNDISTGIEIVP